MVNGMIVDGLGHVSLDSGTAIMASGGGVQQSATNLSTQQQPNIHQGNSERLSRKRNRRQREMEDQDLAQVAAFAVVPSSESESDPLM